MGTVKINERLTVASQPSATEFDGFAAEGYGTVINTRPDGEEAGQPGNLVEKSSAKEAGMNYVFIPVTGPSIREADIHAFQQAMADADGPVLARQ